MGNYPPMASSTTTSMWRNFKKRREVPSGAHTRVSAMSNAAPQPLGRGLCKGTALDKGGNGGDRGPNAVALIAVVKLSRDVASDDAKKYLDFLSLRPAFTWVLHPMLCTSTVSQH